MCKPSAPTYITPEGSGWEIPEPEYPGPSESELALADIAEEKYANWGKHYDPVEADFLAEQDVNKADYGKMMGYADAQQVTGSNLPAQINVSGGAGLAGIGELTSAATQGQAAAAGAAEAADFQRRNANKLWGLSAANKLQAANQNTLASVANTASNAAISTSLNAQRTSNALAQQSFSNQADIGMMKYNYNQGRIQNLAQMGSSLLGYYRTPNTGFGNPGGGLGNTNMSGGAIGQWNQNNNWF